MNLSDFYSGKYKTASFIILATLLLCSPVLILTIKFSTAGSFYFLAADAFYYLKIADNYLHLGKYTFDGIHSTNGFHPLLQYTLGAIFYIFNITAKESQVVTLFALSFIMSAGGAVMIGACLLRYSKSLLLPLAAAVPGLYFIIFHPFTGAYQNYGSIWSFYNGMESGLSLFFFGCLCTVLVSLQSSKIQLILSSMLLPCIVLARLDDVFILVAFMIFLFPLFGKYKPIRQLFLLFLPSGVAIICYLIYNYLTCEMWMPASGSQKFSLAAIHNLYYFIDTVLPLKLLKSKVSLGWINEAWRSMLLFIPFLSSLFFLIWSLRNPNSNRLTQVVRMLSVYCMCKGAYNILFVDLYHQGHWYFAISLMVFSLQLFVYTRSLKTNFIKPMSTLHYCLFTTFGILYLLVLTNTFSDSLITRNYNTHYLHFFQNKNPLQQKVNSILKHSKMVEVDDGIVGYTLDIYTLSGTGLCLDKQALQAKKHFKFLELANHRGYHYLSSLNYFNSRIPNNSTAIKQMLIATSFFTLKEVENFNFSFALKDPSGLVLIKFLPL